MQQAVNTSLVTIIGMEKATGTLHPVCCISLSSKVTRVWFRSPWSNEYDPPLDDGTVPTPRLRKLEIMANEAFDTYREMCVASEFSRRYSCLTIELQVL